MDRKSGGQAYSLRNRLVCLMLVAIVPFLSISIYLIVAMEQYSSAYDEIVSNMTVANSYNLDFMERMDESTYKLVVGAVNSEDPYALIGDLRSDFVDLMRITTDKSSRKWLQSLLRNLNTLEDRLDDIRANVEEGGHYDENLAMLDNNIYILTELIQDDLAHYIYYQAQSMEYIKQELNRKIELFITIVVIMVAVLVIVVLSTSLRLVNSITKPIRELVSVTNRISQGDFQARAAGAGTRELDSLSHSVNDMAQGLEQLVTKIKKDERKMRRTELRLLQEQINPHFLYNTLDTIVWLIEGNMAKEAEEMVVSLSDFFRLVLNHGREYNRIRDEEKHVRSYLQIQQVRYRDILEYRIAIDPEILDYEILKMTLQPLVENSLYHGIKYKRAKGLIEITGHETGDGIELCVSDNGVGMDKTTLDRLREEIERPCQDTEAGFGLANVNERIKMNFGAQYGLKLESKQGEGTRVTVLIPKRSCKEEEVADE